MKAIITGASGAIGSALSSYLTDNGHTTIAWDRSHISIDNYSEMEAFLKSHQPDVLFHLATASESTGRANESWFVNYEWTSELAWLTRTLDIRFVFTSSVMVFSDNAKGPFTTDSVPDADAGYGHEKYQAEQRTFYQNPEAVVARLGWQIGDAPGSNNMIDFFDKQMKDNGVISASSKWFPATSFIEDTVVELVRLVEAEKGLYLLDSNADTKANFYQIATVLNSLHGNIWKVTPNEDFVYDQRMIDPRSQIASLSTRLPAL